MLVPPLTQPRSPVLPAGVRISMLKPPGAVIAEDGMATVSWVLLTTAAVKIVPLKITSEEATKWVPVAVMTREDGSCENSTVVGEIEVRTGAGRALLHNGFSALQPSRTRGTISTELRRPIRKDERITQCSSRDKVAL